MDSSHRAALLNPAAWAYMWLFEIKYKIHFLSHATYTPSPWCPHGTMLVATMLTSSIFNTVTSSQMSLQVPFRKHASVASVRAAVLACLAFYSPLTFMLCSAIKEALADWSSIWSLCNGTGILACDRMFFLKNRLSILRIFSKYIYLNLRFYSYRNQDLIL